MALEAVVFPQDAFGAYAYCKDIWPFLGGSPSAWNLGGFDSSEPSHAVAGAVDSVNYSTSSTPEACAADQYLTYPAAEDAPAAATVGRRKRRRSRGSKNREDVENQRMAHITVERNRRKQMNEYLAVLRSLMPPSYVQRGDQASIIGGAINYVKELEQKLQARERERQKIRKQGPDDESGTVSPLPFSDFFTYPQYSESEAQSTDSSDSTTTASHDSADPEARRGVADVEVTMVESHANVRIRSKRRPRQLLKIVAGFQTLRLTTLHLNVTTAHQTVLYSLSVKAEDGCQLNTVDDIAAAANLMLGRIHEESLFNQSTMHVS